MLSTEEMEETKQSQTKETASKDLSSAAAAESEESVSLSPLDDAINELEKISKKDVGEVKAYYNPPREIGRCFAIVLLLLGESDLSWPSCKRFLTGDFITRLKNFDTNSVSADTFAEIKMRL